MGGSAETRGSSAAYSTGTAQGYTNRSSATVYLLTVLHRTVSLSRVLYVSVTMCLRAEKNEAYFFLSSSFFLQSPFSITLFCFSCNNMRALNPDSEKNQFARFPSNSRPLVLLVVNICRLNSMARACAQTGVGRGGEQGDMKS